MTMLWFTRNLFSALTGATRRWWQSLDADRPESYALRPRCCRKGHFWEYL